MLVVEFQSRALESAYCGLWVVFVYEFGEFLGEVGCWRVFCVLDVKPFVPCRGRSVGEATAPDGRCTPIPLVFAYFNWLGGVLM